MRVPVKKLEGSTLVDAILGFAVGVSGVCEWLESVEKGEPPGRAAQKAYRNARKRSMSLKKAGKRGKLPREKRREEGETDEGGVVIDMPTERKERAR